jgi:transposase
MANALSFKVKESFSELKKLHKSAAAHIAPRIRMLMVAKQSDQALSKNDLADSVGVNHNSIQQWRSKYMAGGIASLLKDGRVGFKPSVISKQAHQKIKVKLHNPIGAFTSYKDLQIWVDTELVKRINYNTLRHYVKRHFGAKLKAARKSHVKKDKDSGEAFKKTSVKSVRIK